MKKTQLAIVVGQVLCGAAAYGATISSNGTGGGSWSTSGTWQGGQIPSNCNIDILASDSVDATNVNINDAGVDNPTILGTLVVDSGSSIINMYNINDAVVTNGAIEVTNGGVASGKYLEPASGSTFTVYVTNGTFTLSQYADAYVTVNINSGGFFKEGTYPSGEPINLQGGTLVCPSALMATWTSGTYVTNTQTNYSVTYAQPTSNYLSANPGDVLNLSNSATPQTLTLYNTNKFNPTGGTIQINVYGATTNDNDLLTYTGSGDFYSISSGVTVNIDGMGDLSGTPSSYLGTSYQLFSDTGNYANLNPTLGAVQWDINGTEYAVSFTNDINSNGTVIVSSLTAVPEPAALAMFSLASLLFLRRRRAA